MPFEWRAVFSSKTQRFCNSCSVRLLLEMLLLVPKYNLSVVVEGWWGRDLGISTCARNSYKTRRSVNVTKRERHLSKKYRWSWTQNQSGILLPQKPPHIVQRQWETLLTDNHQPCVSEQPSILKTLILWTFIISYGIEDGICNGLCSSKYGSVSSIVK